MTDNIDDFLELRDEFDSLLVRLSEIEDALRLTQGSRAVDESYKIEGKFPRSRFDAVRAKLEELDAEVGKLCAPIFPWMGRK